MKNFSKLFLMILIVFFVIPVFAKDSIIIKDITGETDNKNVIIEKEEINISFNDLNQSATYTIKLENNTDKTLYVNDLQVEGISEEFIEFSLNEDSYNSKIAAGKTKSVEIDVKTLEITQAGRNVNDEITLKILLSEKIKNPETSSNWIVYLILIITLIITFSTMFKKLGNKNKFSIFVIVTLLYGTIIVSASDSDYIELNGKVKYTSQNLLTNSPTIIDSGTATWPNEFKYIKNIIISSEVTEIKEPVLVQDFTINGKQRVMAYAVENGDSKVPFDIYIMSKGVIYAPEDATGLFSFPNVETIRGLENVIFDNTTNMTGMFLGNKKLKDVNISKINTTNVTNASYMFYNCLSLNIDKTKLDLEHIEVKDKMFGISLSGVVEQNAKSDKNTDFSKAPVAGNYIMEGTKNYNNPIYYCRGAVENNNVIFANYCWKIVRTTETGGVKLIYNGVPNNGTCNNTGSASQIGTSTFNYSATSPAFVGYMYGTEYTISKIDLTSQNQEYLYGNDITWDGTKYILKDTIYSSKWSTDKKTLASKYHYTCFNNIGSCQNVYYISSFENEDDMPYFLTLKNGKNIENAKAEMFTNKTNSKIKTTIDNWYVANMTSYTKYLEDIVWCNDRTLFAGSLRDKDSDGTIISYFSAYNRNMKTFKPSVACSNTRDSFTVSTSNGNGKLTYPVGLLTADEYTLAGSGNNGYSTTSYLHTGEYQWSLSPYYFNYNYAGEFSLYSNGYLNSGNVSYSRGVRPSVSLKSDIGYVQGNGTKTNPYIVE
ncbi:MAG: BspA family leucine-rich repeat surface protein [Bacilli bacterium]|nr:BspA family leucine-rich repeat surface protein [Bacilli bacterium]